MTAVITFLMPIALAAVWAIVGYANSWLKNNEVDWGMFISTLVIGALIGAYFTVTGETFTNETLVTTLGVNFALVTVLDKFLHLVKNAIASKTTTA